MMNIAIKELYSRQFKVYPEDVKVEALSSVPRENGIEFEFRVTVYKDNSFTKYNFKCLSQEEESVSWS